LRAVQPELAFLLVISSSSDLELPVSLLRAPGVGVINNNLRPDSLESIAKVITAGHTVIGSRHRGKIFDRLHVYVSKSLVGILTLREAQALEGLAMGLSESELAQKMGLSLRATQDCVARAREKLSARSRTHAVAIAVQAGLVNGPLRDMLSDGEIERLSNGHGAAELSLTAVERGD
jgi:DNA-binding NarL/FixJ family response regulator